MAHVSIDRHIPVPLVVPDPARQEVSFTMAIQLTVTYHADEARRFGDEWWAALATLAVKDAPIVLAAADVSEA